MITFLPRQAAILLHRLEVPEAIAQALEEDLQALEQLDPTKGPFTEDAVLKACAFLEQALRTHRKLNLSGLTAVQKLVLIDCVEGSTYLDWTTDELYNDEIDKAEADKRHRAAHTLVVKLRNAGLICGAVPG